MKANVIIVSREDLQTWAFRGSKSRNKVSVGEPAEGSLLIVFLLKVREYEVKQLLVFEPRFEPRGFGLSALACYTLGEVFHYISF